MDRPVPKTTAGAPCVVRGATPRAAVVCLTLRTSSQACRVAACRRSGPIRTPAVGPVIQEHKDNMPRSAVAGRALSGNQTIRGIE